MKTLGFKIIRFRQGPQEILSVNDGEWDRKVVDIGDTLKIFSSEDKDKFAFFMSFSENGTYLTIAKFIPGRPGEYLAAWIYVPNNLDVEGEKLESLIKEIKQSMLSNKTEGLKELFSKEYKSTIAATFIQSSNEKKYALRNTVFFSLKELIGNKRYQSYYSQYNAIILYGDDSMQIKDQSIVDLSQEPLTESFIFCPPVKCDMPSGVTIHFKKPELPLFDQPIRVKKGEKVEVVFCREGFENINDEYFVTENEQICGVPKKWNWELIIKYSWLKVVDADNNSVDLTGKAIISINNKELSKNSSMKLTESEAQKASVSISSGRYESKQYNVNFLENKKQQFKLNREERSNTWKIDLINGRQGEIVIKSKYLPEPDSSPLKGYSSTNDRLVYTPSDKWLQRLIGFIAAVAIWLIVLFIGWWNSVKFIVDSDFPWFDVVPEKSYYKNMEGSKVSEDNSEQSTGEGIEENSDINAGAEGPSEASENISEEGKLYLEKNNSWNRDKMIQYNLGDLWDALNKYNFEKIKKYQAELCGIELYDKLIEAINKIPDATIFAGRTRCNGNDFEIDIKGYIKHITTPQSKAPSVSGNESHTGGVASDAAKKVSSQKQKNSEQPAKQKSNSDNTTEKNNTSDKGSRGKV